MFNACRTKVCHVFTFHFSNIMLIKEVIRDIQKVKNLNVSWTNHVQPQSRFYSNNGQFPHRLQHIHILAQFLIQPVHGCESPWNEGSSMDVISFAYNVQEDLYTERCNITNCIAITGNFHIAYSYSCESGIICHLLYHITHASNLYH